MLKAAYKPLILSSPKQPCEVVEAENEWLAQAGHTESFMADGNLNLDFPRLGTTF